MLKWNMEKSNYEPYKISKDWFCPLYCNDLEEPINCTCCGTEITYGTSFTSLVIHNDFGMGYPVCEDCYEKEIATEMLYRGMMESEDKK